MSYIQTGGDCSSRVITKANVALATKKPGTNESVYTGADRQTLQQIKHGLGPNSGEGPNVSDNTVRDNPYRKNYNQTRRRSRPSVASRRKTDNKSAGIPAQLLQF